MDVTGYALAFASFLLTGGKLADLLGRRLVYMAGLLVFAGSSLACAPAPSAGFLIGARVVQGRRGPDESGDLVDHHGDVPCAAARSGDRPGSACRRAPSRSGRWSAAC